MAHEKGLGKILREEYLHSKRVEKSNGLKKRRTLETPQTPLPAISELNICHPSELSNFSSAEKISINGQEAWEMVSDKPIELKERHEQNFLLFFNRVENTKQTHHFRKLA